MEASGISVRKYQRSSKPVTRGKCKQSRDPATHRQYFGNWYWQATESETCESEGTLTKNIRIGNFLHRYTRDEEFLSHLLQEYVGPDGVVGYGHLTVLAEFLLQLRLVHH
jgi:hypothetical protein